MANTFGVFFIHPLFGYLFACFLSGSNLHIIIQILILDIGVFTCSFLWSEGMKRLPIIGKLIGGL